jgi:hypothetical protein
MYRELSTSEAATRGLPSRSPVEPYEEIVWAEASSDIETVPARVTPTEVLATRKAA